MAFGTNRRELLKRGAALAALAPGMALFSGRGHAADKVVIKYDWLISNGQIADVVAASRGYFEEAGIAVEFSPGGPNSATVPPVVSGAAALGQFSETPQLFAARAAGVPVRVMACGFRTGPYAFASLPSAPLRPAPLGGGPEGVEDRRAADGALHHGRDCGEEWHRHQRPHAGQCRLRQAAPRPR